MRKKVAYAVRPPRVILSGLLTNTRIVQVAARKWCGAVHVYIPLHGWSNRWLGVLCRKPMPLKHALAVHCVQTADNTEKIGKYEV